MKKPIIFIVLSFLLFCFSCLSPQYKQLIHLTSKELPTETQLILTLTEAVEFREIKLENSPFILLDFHNKDVYSQEEKEIVINRGPVKNIKNVYSQAKGKDSRQLNFILIELTQILPYKISRNKSSLLITIQNPQPSQLTKTIDAVKLKPATEFDDLTPRQSEGYLIGPGDVLSIEVWRHPDTSREVTVNYRGEITLPPIKKKRVQGLSTPQLEEELTEALSEFLIDPVVFVTIKEYNSQRITVLGETTPGMYTLRRKTNLLEFLGEIGGPTKTADIFKTRLIKKNGTIHVYDLEKLLLNPQESQKIILEGGDTIYIPPLKYDKIYVLGEVKNAKSIQVQGKITLADAITEAGGFGAYAIQRSIIVIRGEVGSQKGIRVDFESFRKLKDLSQNIELEPGDIVYVPKSFVENIERFMRIMFNPILWTMTYVTR